MVDRVFERNASQSAPQPPADPSVGYPTAGNPAQGVPATLPGPYWYHMITESLRRVVVEAGLTPDHEDLDQLLDAIKANGQFADYSAGRIYATGEIVRGSDGQFYEFYDRDQAGNVQGVDPTNAANRPHIWMEWDGVKPGSTIEWRSETLPEGYVENDGAELSRADYRRVFAAHGTTYGAGDGSTTFLLPDDRGEFKRGWDNGRGVDSARSLAAHQWHAVERHVHALPTGTGIDGSGHWGVADEYWQQTNSSGVNNTPASGQTAGTYHDDSGDGSPSGVAWTPGNYADETRPRNNAVIYLTKI